MYYFSYGSNMSSRRLRARLPSSTLVDTGLLRAHRLMFHKLSHVDGSAKCDARQTGNAEDYILGVLFNIEESEKPLLDHVEGLGIGYGEKTVSIRTSKGLVIEAFTYHALHIANDIKPFTWYKEHVLRGASEHCLPPDYIAGIECVAAVTDPDRNRHDRELSIYWDAQTTSNT